MNGFIVHNGGLQSSIQDAGRKGFSDIGLTQSGAMDELSFGYANMLVGNPFNTPTIEIALGGLALKIKGTVTLALTGADMSLGFASSGHFAYLAVAGGLQTPYAYGSFSTSIKEGLGGLHGRKLLANDFIASTGKSFPAKRRLHKEFIPTYPESVTLRVLKGYQEAHFHQPAQDVFFNSVYTYKGEGDRMGYRLSGEKIECSLHGILSEPICFGAIQVPSHGEPIVLLKERQTIGGYPKIGSVIGVDCFRLAQVQAGGKIRFAPIGYEEARAKAQAFYRFFRF